MRYNKMIKKRGLVFFVLLFVIILIGFVSAQGNEPSVCCERTTSGAFCQNVPESQCDSNSRSLPTSCDATSFCRPGTCYDSTEGTCLDNTPQLVCNANEGVWSEEPGPQCDLGCCVLGDQASFVSLVRCKRLSGFLGLETNYDSSIDNELECIAKVQNQEKGACVFEFEFEKTCKFTTREDCQSSTEQVNGTLAQSNFFLGKLCSAEELGTICGPTTRTACSAGKDEVYFLDSCGNTGNIYDASKVNDKEYWTNLKNKNEVCGAGAGNILNPNCGNCDYLQGSYCRSENVAGRNPVYGDYICADLNCKDTENGNDYKHGESWCVYDDFGGFGDSKNSVGSRFYKHICINGEEVLEQCADFRAEECIQDEVNGFSQSACRANRWQDCILQDNENDCINTDRRDCIWRLDLKLQLNLTKKQQKKQEGTCYPSNTPGFNFWDDEETKNICAQGNAQCVVKYEKGVGGGWSCVSGCECLKDEWAQEKGEICGFLGDCGGSVNWLGKEGNNKGYKVITEGL
jgi:hypothetical protein